MRFICSFFIRAYSPYYAGEVQDELAPIVGHTVNLRLLWDNVIFTTEPDNIKVSSLAFSCHRVMDL